MVTPGDVRYSLNRRYIKSDSSAIVFLALEIHSREDRQRRNRVNMSLAIDCSSSMQGVKIEQAKDAALRLLRQLRSDDIFSVVTFDKNARVIIPSTRKGELHSGEGVISGIRLGEGTNIHDAILRAYEEIRKSDDRDAIGRIVLLTDGEASAGPRELKYFSDLCDKARTAGMTVTALGIGDDYNQDFNETIAYHGGGRPRRISEINDLHEVFGEELKEASETVLVSPTLNISFLQGSSVLEGYTVTPVLKKVETKELSNQFTIKLKDLIVGHEQTLIFKINVPEKASGTYQLAEISIGDLRKTIEITVTENYESYEREIDPYPEMLFNCTSATTLVKLGLQTKDPERIKKADKMMKSLFEDGDFVRISSRKPWLRQLASKVKGIIQKTSEGLMSDSDTKEAISQTTIIYQ